MATQSRAQVTKRKKATGRKPRKQQATGLSLWALRGREFLSGVFPEVNVSDRLKREVLGVALVLLALLSSWALGRGSTDGAFVAWWGNVLRDTFGNGAFLMPVFAALTSVRAFSHDNGPILLFRHYIGGVLFVLAVVALLSFGYAGGGLGNVTGDIGRGVLGQLASGLVFFALGVIAVFLISDTDLQTLAKDIQRLIPERTPKPKPHVSQAVAVPAAAPVPKVRKSEPKAKASTPRVPKAAALTPEVVEPEPERHLAPIINLPAQPDRGAVKEVVTLPPPIVSAVQGDLPIPMPLPDLQQLPYYESVSPDPKMLEDKAEVIEDTLRSFKVDAKVREINPGPAVTQFALEPGNGVKVRRITELQNDLALALAAQSIRVEAPIPGMARVGIEIPNPQIATVGLREVLESPAFSKSKAKLPLPLGRDVNGRYIVGDLTKMPHLLIAGATGSGKSVCINAIISTLISVKQPDELRLLMIDPKMVELVGYNGVPHLQAPVVTEMDKVVSALRMVLREMNRRYELFKQVGVRNLAGYRSHTADDPEAERLPYFVVIIDELADLMMTTPDEVETLLARLTQMARATGIHLIIATQRPSVNVLTGLIKANVPARIAFAVSSMIDSRVVLDMPGAERLLGRGDMLYLPPDEAKPTRVQGAFIDDEVKSIVDHWLAVSPVPQYAPEWVDLPSSKESKDSGGSGGGWEDEEEPYMQQALDIVRAQGTASASMLQRRLRIGYNRAARIIEQMEEDGIIGPADGAKGRPVLVGFDTPDLD
jgi:S-DNA-T family DNA segregation ATPase FtsK/SpoIIIE